ncbi:hypothetical protein [Alkalilacustris brevis]|uniref:hypothetical protein n=1 Tax=Alkalilacustris brevis TaxID=2026338 RepID=UPI000E0D4339|nr:hypothetical protein [Alkalilacustris brevis]
MTGTPGYARDVLRRRLPGAALLALGVLALALALAVLWPPVYRAEAVLLAAPNDAPDAATAAVETREVRTQITMIAQRLITRTSLIEASRDLALHDAALHDSAAIVQDMRARIALDVEGGGEYALTVRLGFSAPNPRVAANVANALADVLIRESLAAPDALSLQRRDIIEREARRHDAELEQHSLRLAEFRAAHVGALPEALPRLRAEAAAISAELAALPVAAGGDAPSPEAAALRARLDNLRSDIAAAEANAVTLARLARARDAAQSRYQAAMHRFSALHPAPPGTGIGSGSGNREGEAIDAVLQLTLLDPARAPERPETPDRGLIAAAGLGLGLLAGLGFILGAEALDQTVRTPRDVTRRLGQAPLVTIALMPDPASQGSRQSRRQMLALVVPAGLVMVLFGVHVLVVPLDVLLARAVALLGLEPLLDGLHRAIAG